jgi:histidine ammonia-lyase
MNHKPWQAIFEKYEIHKHNFTREPYILTAEQIKKATSHFSATNEREVRVLCKQDSSEILKCSILILPMRQASSVRL